MPNIKRLSHQLRIVPLINKLREIHCDLLFNWILHSKSQPLTLSRRSAMVFAPHQDDETLGCGGMIALKRAQGISVRVVFLTDGQASRGGTAAAAAAHAATQRHTLVQTRKQEAIAALTILGIAPSEIDFLDQSDGTLRHLSDAQRQHTIDCLAHLLRTHQPAEVYVTHRTDRHQDHEATYELVQAAVSQSGQHVELLQYSIWMFWKAPLFLNLKLQEVAGAYRLSIAAVLQQKRRAIEVYQSQDLPRSFLQRFFLPYEIFFKTDAE